MENPTTGEKCPFCYVDREVIIENQDAMAILDLYPVSAGHALVIPKIHIASVFDLPNPVYVACFNLFEKLKASSKAGTTRMDLMLESIAASLRVRRSCMPTFTCCRGIRETCRTLGVAFGTS